MLRRWITWVFRKYEREGGELNQLREQVTRILDQRGMSINRLAQRMGLDASYVLRMLRGSRRISQERAEQFAEALDMKLIVVMVERGRRDG